MVEESDGQPANLGEDETAQEFPEETSEETAAEHFGTMDDTGSPIHKSEGTNSEVTPKPERG